MHYTLSSASALPSRVYIVCVPSKSAVLSIYGTLESILSASHHKRALIWICVCVFYFNNSVRCNTWKWERNRRIEMCACIAMQRRSLRSYYSLSHCIGLLLRIQWTDAQFTTELSIYWLLILDSDGCICKTRRCRENS